MSTKTVILALVVVLFGSLATGRLLQDKELETQSESTAQAIGEHDVINAALANADARPAITKSLVYARLATRDTTEPWMVDGSTGARKLLQQQTNTRSDRISQSLSAASDVIAKAVAAGGEGDATNAAAQRSGDYARLTTRDVQPWAFDTKAGAHKRSLLQQQTNTRSDRISQSLSAASDVIAKAVAAGGEGDATNAAAQRSADYARLTTRDVQPWVFDTTTGPRK
jgi:hypothetical protein